MRRRPVRLLAAAFTVLAVGACAAGAASGPDGTWRGTAASTHDKVKLQIGATGKVRFTYACREDDRAYVYTGRLGKGGRFDLVHHSAVLRTVVVAEVIGKVKDKRASGTVQQDVCGGAVEGWKARHR